MSPIITQLYQNGSKKFNLLLIIKLLVWNEEINFSRRYLKIFEKNRKNLQNDIIWHINCMYLIKQNVSTKELK